MTENGDHIVRRCLFYSFIKAHKIYAFTAYVLYSVQAKSKEFH